MAPPQRSRVLRCCSCRLFQAHQEPPSDMRTIVPNTVYIFTPLLASMLDMVVLEQSVLFFIKGETTGDTIIKVKKSLKWTCKACGEKQSFLRAYGEGSGADCRRHVQKLNLLQGQASALSLRSLEEALSTSKEEHASCQQAKGGSLQEKWQLSESRWLKYLDEGHPQLDGGGASVHPQPLHSIEQLGPPFSHTLPRRKRKWSQSPTQPPRGHGDQDADGTTGPSGPQEGYSSSCHTRELHFPRWRLPGPSPQAKAPPSKWARFLLSPASHSHEDTELSRPAEQETTRTGTLREDHLSGQATGTLTPSPERPGGEPPPAEDGPVAQGAQRAPPAQLCGLFATGEDFDDDL